MARALKILLVAWATVGCLEGRDLGPPTGTRIYDGGPAGRDGGVAVATDGGPGVDGGVVDAGSRDGGARDGGGGARDSGPRDGGPSGGGACPDYLAFDRVGREWTMRSTVAGEQTGVMTTTTQSLVLLADRGDHYEVVIESQIGQTTASSTIITDATYTYRCDAGGAWLEHLTQNSQGTAGDQPFSSTNTTTYSPALLVAPANVQVGASFSTVSSVRSMGLSNGTPYDSTTEITHGGTFETVGTVTVPAGTFSDTVRIRHAADRAADYARGVGFLTDGYTELRTYR